MITRLVTTTHNTVARKAPLLHHSMQHDRAGKTVILSPKITQSVVPFILYFQACCMRTRISMNWLSNKKREGPGNEINNQIQNGGLFCNGKFSLFNQLKIRCKHLQRTARMKMFILNETRRFY